MDPGIAGTQPAAPATPPPEAPTDGEPAPEAVLVLDATRTLHRDHDPQRALELVARYLETYPHGALEEESLALVIEAKARLGDAGATSAARDYLQRFPHGRFRTLALQALGKAGP